MPIPTKYLLSPETAILYWANCLNKAYRAYRANRADKANSTQRLIRLIVFYWANRFYLANKVIRADTLQYIFFRFVISLYAVD